MKHKCYISFKQEDKYYKNFIQNSLDIEFIDKSLNSPIDSEDEDYIMQRIREDYLSDSTVTLFLIGKYSNENLGKHEQRFIKRELQASLYNGSNNTRSGLLGIILPSMKDAIIKGSITCHKCGNNHNIINLDNTTVVSEFHYNYFIPNGKCSHTEEERYCILVPWDTFKNSPETYIENAFLKREENIAKKVKVKP